MPGVGLAQVTVTRTFVNPAVWSRMRIAVLFAEDRSAVSEVTIQPRKYCPAGTDVGIRTFSDPLHQLVKVFR